MIFPIALVRRLIGAIRSLTCLRCSTSYTNLDGCAKDSPVGPQSGSIPPCISIQSYDTGYTAHAIKCFWEHTEEQKVCYSKPDRALLEALTAFLLVRGVKIGGVYKHWKGDLYEVTGVVRDADYWDRYRVTYVQVNDIQHKGDRFLDEFLGMHDKGVRRFTLVA